MADRTSAEIFGDLFEQLAEINDATAKKLARWAISACRNYDFTNDQMGCDDALIKLKVAKHGKNEFGEDVVLYKEEDY